MPLKIVTGGTTGAADGTLVSSSNKLTFTALNTAIDAHIRCDDGYWTNDEDFTVPTEVEVSFDGGLTWYDSGDNPITVPEIEDVNYAIKFRQTTAAASTSGTLTSGLTVTYSAITALSTPTLTATGGDTIVDLSWTNVANEDGYTIERGTDGVNYSALTTKSAGVTTHQDTGRTNGTTYYYRVRAEGSGRYSDSGWGSANATPAVSVTFTDNFDNSSLDTARFGTITNAGGTVTETTSLALGDDGTTSNKIACVYLKAEVSLATAQTYRARVVNTAGTDALNQLTLFGTSGSAPVYADLSDINKWIVSLVHRPGGSGVSIYYNTGTWAGTAMPGQTNLSSMSTSNYYDYILEVKQNTGVWQVQATIKNNSGTTISQSNWVNASSLASYSKYWLIVGRPYQDGAYNGSLTVQQFQVS